MIPTSTPASRRTASTSLGKSPICRLAWAALLSLGAFGPALAQVTYDATLYNNLSNVFGSIYPNTSPHYDAINFATDNGSQLDVDQDMDFNESILSAVFTSTKFTSTGGRVPASLFGTDEFTIPIYGRTFIVQNFALDNVDLTTSRGAIGDLQLKIQGFAGGNTILSLANSSLNCALTPTLYAPSALAFNVSGSSQITGWQGYMASRTTLDVARGGTLAIKNCGNLAAAAPAAEKIYFSNYNNLATLNGSVLIIDNSALIFGLNPFDRNNNQSTLTFSNNATLLMLGLNPYTKLETDRVELQDSTLNLSNNNTRLTLRTHLKLDNSSARIANGAEVTASDVFIMNSSTVTLQGMGMVTDSINLNPGAHLNLTGPSGSVMRVSSRVNFPAAGVGAIHISDHAYLTLYGSGVNSVNLNDHALLTTTTYASLSLQDAAMNLYSSSTFTNGGTLNVEAPSFINIYNHTTIHGAGDVNIKGTLWFDHAATSNQANNTLTTNNKLWFDAAAVVNMTLDPNALSSDRLICSGQIDINNHPHLTLNVTNDVPLILGTKFVLIDYSTSHGYLLDGGLYGACFNGYTNNHTFTLGLNTYQIRYNDDTYLPPAKQYTTLTVVSNGGYGILSVSTQGTNALLTWPTTYTNFMLETTPFLISTNPPHAVIWSPVPGTLVLTNGDYLITMPMNQPQQFFRLHRP